MKSRSVCRDPVWPSIVVHEHRRIATRGYDPVCDLGFLELISPEEFGSLGALDAVFSIEYVSRSAIGIAYSARIWQSFDLISPLPAVVAITHIARDRTAERFEFDATA